MIPLGLRTAAASVRLEWRGRRLVLVWTPHYPGRVFVPQAAREVELADGIARVEFSYWQAGDHPGWVDRWSAHAAPALIRMRLVPDAADRAPPMPDIVAAPFRAALP